MESIETIEESDYLDLDGRQLRLLLAIRKAGSLSGAARVLGMNQSTVSYWLDQMRHRLNDPLFVRAGNGVESTQRAKAIFLWRTKSCDSWNPCVKPRNTPLPAILALCGFR